MDANASSVGKPVNYLLNAEYVQIFFHQIPKCKIVLSGKAVCIINNDVRFEINIAEQMPKQLPENEAGQRVDNNLILVRDLKSAFADFKK